MAINELKLTLARNLQELFRNKTTGAPLRNGVVYFWKDSARTVAKSVYKQTGSPPNYSYIELPNPLTLSSIGSFQDPNSNDDINVYYYPYDEETGSDIENYFIEVYSEGGKATGVQQWTREGWPNASNAAEDAQLVENFIPNGQFLVHNDIPATDTTEAGEITEASTIIAQGGWSFDRPETSSAKDFVTFEEIEYTVNPTGNPRFAARIVCEMANAGDTYKDLRVKFNDVNKFASTTEQYTFALTAQSNNSSSVTASAVLIKNYGTGGSGSDETVLGTLTIESGYTIIQPEAFVFGSNSGETITADSNVQLAIRFPTNAIYDISLTDFILTPNAVAIAEFPATPDADFKRDSIFGWVDLPNPDGSQLYLKPVLTRYGMTWDDSEIGEAVLETQLSEYVDSLHPTTNKMLADGNKYLTSDYSDLGIPFSRIFNKWFDDTAGVNVPIYGTGSDYFTCAFSGSGNQLIISNNEAGSVTDAADVSTTFTISNVHQGDAGYICKAYLVSASNMNIQNLNAGVVTAISAGTSGFAVATLQAGTSVLPNISGMIPIAAAGLAGLYFTFSVYNGVDVPLYCWFTVDGAGADPAPGGLGIRVNLLSTDSAAIVAQKIQTSLNGWEVTSIQTVAASAVPAGSYFTISATGDNYYIWYKKDGAGTDPAPANKIGIQVDILAADTNTQVATKTQIAINSYSFASPDARGQFLRAANSGATVDPGDRWSMVPGVIGNETLGTFELSDNLSHTHGSFEPIAGAGAGAGASYEFVVEDVLPSGGTESRPINMNLTLAIRY
jgi:hypothetical protein